MNVMVYVISSLVLQSDKYCAPYLAYLQQCGPDRRRACAMHYIITQYRRRVVMQSLLLTYRSS